MSKYTPGPWVLDDGAPSQLIWEDMEEGALIADLSRKGHNRRVPSHDERKANARLIAAAPDLLAALEVLVRRVEDYAPWMARTGELVEARIAIAKALGKGLDN